MSIVDDEAVREVDRKSEGTTDGYAQPTAPAGGYVVLRSYSSWDHDAVAHELIHLALGPHWEHDSEGLFAEYRDGLDVEPRTKAALQQFCDPPSAH